MRLAPIPLVDLGVVNGFVSDGLRDAFERVVAASAFTGGEEVERFEEELAHHLGVPHVVGVASGTAALHLALLAAGVGPGDEVILPANTFVATAESVLATGARPVLADVVASTALLDPDAVEAAVTPRTAAVVPVHLYGQPVDADRFSALADRHGLFLLEDAAQALGASWNRRPAGALGTAGGFSFYPAKTLGALGDGGAVTTGDAGLARAVRLLRSHGEERRNDHLVAGWCERLDGLQAAFLRAKLAAFGHMQELRAAVVVRYRSLLRDLPGVSWLDTDPRAQHAHHLLVLRVPHRDRLLKLLRDAGIGAAVHYPVPIHLQPATPNLGAPGDFPVAEALADSVISMPLFPGMTDAQVDRCVGALATALERVA